MHAAELGISAAKLLKAEITTIYVVDTVALDQIAKTVERTEVEAELTKDGEKNLAFVVDLAEKQGVKATYQIVKGLPFEQVVYAAKNLDADLIVMGTYGRRSPERILMGSVAEQVIHYASCPVLVVKGK